MTNIVLGGSTPSDGFELKSLRFPNVAHNSGSAYLSWTPATAGNRKTWTYSAWVKRTSNGGVSDGNYGAIFGAWNNSSLQDELVFRAGTDPDNYLSAEIYEGGGSGRGRAHTEMVFNDPTAWYHIVWVWNTTLSTAADRSIIYVNGERAAIRSATLLSPAVNSLSQINNNVIQLIGQQGDSSQWNTSYLAELYFIDGQALGPEYFGETNTLTNQWQPKNPTDIKEAVTFGVNGFHLPFSNDVLATSFTDADYHVPHTSLTAAGTAHTDTGVKKFGTASLQCDGDSDYLRVPDSSDFSFGTGDFTIEAWVYNTTASGTQRLFSHTSHAVNGKKGWNVYLTSDSQGRFTWSKTGSDEHSWNFANCMTQNTWTHFALTRTGTTLRAFKNGVMVDSTVDSDMTTIWNSSRDLLIGAFEENDSTLSGYWNGYVDEVRISNINRYSNVFSVPTAAYTADKDTKLLLHMDGSNGGTSFTDSSWTGVGGTGHSLTANGNAANKRVVNNPVGWVEDATGGQHIIGPKFGTGCVMFDGSGDSLSVADSSDWDFGTNNFTMEFWVNFDHIHTSHPGFGLLGQWASSSSRWSIYQSNSVVKFYCNSPEIADFPTATSFQPHRWYHLALERSGTTFRWYVDGTIDATVTDGDALPAVSSVLGIANNRDGNYNELKGYMDEIRISNTARYGGTSFTPSTTAFSNDSNTKLLVHCDGAHASTTFTDVSSGTHSITTNGNAKVVAPKIGTGCNRTNGGDNGLYIPGASCPWAEFGSGDFTVEAWVSLDNISTNNQQFFTHRNSVNSGDWVFWWDSSNGLQWSGSSNTLSQGGTTGWASNTWVHIAASRASGVNKIFVNGTVVATNSSATQDYSATASLFIASYSTGTGSHNTSGGNIAGFMDQVRITPGKALYTSNFTPSTTAYTDDIDTRLLMHFDGGGPGTAGSDTNVGQGTYYHDSATNAIYYENNLPKYKSNINFDGTGDYISLPGSSDFDFGTGAFAIEFWFWVKDSHAHTALIHSDNYYVGGNNGNWAFDCYQEEVRFNVYNGTGAVGSVDSTGTKIECGVWNHVAFCRDGSGNGRIFINGALSSSVDTDLNGEDIEDGKNGVEIGGNISYAGPGDLNGGMDNIRISNSARYTSAFTKPTDRVTSDSNTVFLLNSDFADGGLGADHSGNYNSFTPTNLSSHDMMLDSPMNNFCTWNPIDIFAANLAGVVSEGNLKIVDSTNHIAYRGTFGLKSGKWYWEIYIIAAAAPANCRTGVCKTNTYGTSSGTGPVDMGVSYTYDADGQKTIPGSTGSYGATYTAGDIIGVALDMDNGTITFYKNSATQGQMATGIIAEVAPLVAEGNGSNQFNTVANFGQDSSFAGTVTAQGNQDANNKGDFYYAPPSGYLALCTDNLDNPSITDPSKHFNTVTYTGTGSELAVTGVGFQPDFTWIKARALTYNHRLFDVVRGVTKEVYTNVNNAEVTDAQSLKSFDSDGFTLGTGSGSNPSNTMVSWNWKAGTSFDPATAGTVASGSGSANATAGFSIVKYPGSASDVTVGHGLSQAPELIFIKNLDAAVSWPVYVGPLGNTKRLELNDPYYQQATGHWVNTSPTASVFTLDGGVEGINDSGDDFIAYCWHSVEGYSKVGDYTANGSATDGPFVYTGFKPAYLLVKSTSVSASWDVTDGVRNTYNPQGWRLAVNGTGIGENIAVVDFLSNGFKVRTTSGSYNDPANATYFYLAIAESPFKTSNAR
jgi:hypothetical protein